ncbi:MAG: DNA polymerase III subunit delta [bacterium]
MIIFLYGPDSYRSSQKLKEIIAEYKAKHKSGLNFMQLEWAPEVPDEIKSAFSSFSMFDEKKLIVIKGASQASKTDQENLIELLTGKKNVKDDSSIVVFYEAGKAEKNELATWLKKNAKMVECFEALSGANLCNWMKKDAQNSGGEISPGAAEKLAAFVGSDLWQAHNEIDKLVSFRGGKLITDSDVDLLVRSKYDPNIFATIDALANRNKNLAYKLIHQHLEQGENEIYILTMFVYQFRNLLQIKSLIDTGIPSEALAKKTGLHPFVIKKSWGMLRNFSLDVLKKIYERLMKLDIAIKRGKIEPEIALDLIVAEIAG